jgi:SAM-dependent methyltransferase
VGNLVIETDTVEGLIPLLDREHVEYMARIRPTASSDLVMPQDYFRRFDNPPADTPFPLEYAFHLLGDFRGKTVVDFTFHDSRNAVALAWLGARVIAAATSDAHVKQAAARARANHVAERVASIRCDSTTIPVADASVDRVLCVAALHRTDRITTARQIRRILKPGGSAVFVEPIAGSRLLAGLLRCIPAGDFSACKGPSLTFEQAHSVSRAVGRPGRCREFMLTSRLLRRIGVRCSTTLRKSHELDAWILAHFAFARALASPLVWEARKES